MNHMNTTDMYRALRPQGARDTARVIRTLIVCVLLAWLGGCVVEIARSLTTAWGGAVCTSNGGSWSPDGVCVAPHQEIHVHVQPGDPLLGPGGA